MGSQYYHLEILYGCLHYCWNYHTKQFSMHSDSELLFHGINVLNSKPSKQAVESGELLWCARTCTHAHTTGEHYHWIFGSSSKTTEEAAAGTMYRERKGGRWWEIYGVCQKQCQATALRWAPFILADSNLYVKLTSLHRLGSDVLTGAVQLHRQFYSAITQLQGAG